MSKLILMQIVCYAIPSGYILMTRAYLHISQISSVNKYIYISNLYLYLLSITWH